MKSFREFLADSVYITEAWTASSIEDQSGGYGMKSPKGLIRIKKSTGKKYKVDISADLWQDNIKPQKFVGTSQEVSDWLNKYLGLN